MAEGTHSSGAGGRLSAVACISAALVAAAAVVAAQRRIIYRNRNNLRGINLTTNVAMNHANIDPQGRPANDPAKHRG